jgi:hypothetical protein
MGPRLFVAMLMLGRLFGVTADRGVAQIERSSTVQVLWQFEAGG